MQDAPFTIFLTVGIALTALLIGGWYLILRTDKEFGKPDAWALVVAIPIIIPVIAALVVGYLLR